MGNRREENLRLQIEALLPRLRRFARSLTKDVDRADDLVQQACQRALERIYQLRPGSKLDSWLYRIIHTKWIDRVRQDKTRSIKMDLYIRNDDTDQRSNPQTTNLESLIDLKHSFDGIQEEHQAVISLVCIEGYSYSETAAILNIPPGTVASRVARARKILSKRMGPPPSNVHILPQDKRMKGKK